MSKSRSSPRKFAEKIALLNKKEAEGTSEFEKILKEVKETTRVPSQPQQYWGLPARSSSFSDWQTYGPNAPPQQLQYQHPNGGQYLGTSQHVQFSPHNSQIQQTRQHVIATMRQQTPRQHNEGHQHQHPGHSPQLQRPAIFVTNQHTNEYLDTTMLDEQQAHNRLTHYKAPASSPGQPRSIEVPNIEIFPIDDDFHQQQQRQQLVVDPLTMGSLSSAHDTLSNGHHHNDCSNTSITSARSLPNIANLSVTTPPSGQMTTQPMINQPLGSAFGGNNNHPQSTMATTSVTHSNNYDDSYPQDTSCFNYINNDQYCSLPPTVQQPMHAISRHNQTRQSQTHIPLGDSWQQVPLGGLNGPTAMTPPLSIVQGSSYSGSQQASPHHQQMINSPDSSPHRQQHSPQTLHQEYYPSSLNTQASLVRASSMDVINKHTSSDLLEAPRIDGVLSKSTDLHYGSYLESYASNDEFCSGLGDGNGSNLLNNDTNNLYVNNGDTESQVNRSGSENNMDGANVPVSFDFTPNDFVESDEQFLDSSQSPFYE